MFYSDHFSCLGSWRFGNLPYAMGILVMNLTSNASKAQLSLFSFGNGATWVTLLSELGS